ncbi:MAG: hypothetical protein IH606_06310 [Burkholderiales bacterium]|nr:hypothetical protein [Burkholderiales bacterium]
MSLESLLATLENDVSPVAAVQPNAGAAFGCNGTDTADVAAVSTQRRCASPATAATAGNGSDVSRKPASILARTSATAATAENNNTRSDAQKPLTCDRDRDGAANDRRRRLLDLLGKHPGTRYAVLMDNADADPVVLSLGIRNVGTCELALLAAKFDAFALLALIERYGATVH